MYPKQTYVCELPPQGIQSPCLGPTGGTTLLALHETKPTRSLLQSFSTIAEVYLISVRNLLTNHVGLTGSEGQRMLLSLASADDLASQQMVQEHSNAISII
jgi:hypothetical protein